MYRNISTSIFLKIIYRPERGREGTVFEASGSCLFIDTVEHTHDIGFAPLSSSSYTLRCCNFQLHSRSSRIALQDLGAQEHGLVLSGISGHRSAPK